MAPWTNAKLEEAWHSKRQVLGGSNPPGATNLLRGGAIRQLTSFISWRLGSNPTTATNLNEWVLLSFVQSLLQGVRFVGACKILR